MGLSQAIDRLYYNVVLNELDMMNGSSEFPNITYNSLLYLDLISMTENCTVSHLANILHIAKSSVTLKVNELMKQGLVQKRQSQEDRRIHYLSVSPEIYEEYKHFDRVTQLAIQKMETEYSPDEIRLLCKMLHKFSDFYASEQKPSGK